MTKLLVSGLMLPLLFSCGMGSRTDVSLATLPEGPDTRTFASVTSARMTSRQDTSRSERERTRAVVMLVMGHTQDVLSQ